MTSGPIVIQVLGGGRDRALPRRHGRHRSQGGQGRLLRKLFAKNKGENSVHGSDSAAAAEREIKFARPDEIVG